MSTETPLRIAMWSGPRNISTAMMRSWGNRDDTFVCDEPFYANYLLVSGRPHPGADEVIAHHETDWQQVVRWLTSDVPGGKRIFFQKHMTHHLLPHIDRGWLGQVTNWFLIREPREMLTSYVKIVPDPTPLDTGYPQQCEIFDWVRQHQGTVPPIVDAKDVLDAPRRTLGLLCDALHVDFQECMLSWPPGLRSTDGIWARHWYSQVESSTCFRPYTPKPDPVPEQFRDLYEQCLEQYHRLYQHRLR